MASFVISNSGTFVWPRMFACHSCPAGPKASTHGLHQLTGLQTRSGLGKKSWLCLGKSNLSKGGEDFQNLGNTLLRWTVSFLSPLCLCPSFLRPSASEFFNPAAIDRVALIFLVFDLFGGFPVPPRRASMKSSLLWSKLEHIVGRMVPILASSGPKLPGDREADTALTSFAARCPVPFVLQKTTCLPRIPEFSRVFGWKPMAQNSADRNATWVNNRWSWQGILLSTYFFIRPEPSRSGSKRAKGTCSSSLGNFCRSCSL